MELTELGKRELRETLEANGTRPGRTTAIMQGIGRKQLRVAHDGVFTAVVCGDSVGVAKRAQSGTKHDELNEAVGLCIAASRLV